MEEQYCGIPHNHPIKEPIGQELFHEECDPRRLQETCPACAEYMRAWLSTVDRMIAEGS